MAAFDELGRITMCGITGLLAPSHKAGSYSLAAAISGMSDTLVHRGPDDKGMWVDENAGLALGHRRLSIIDLSPEGRQPMESACGRYVIVFNGEIYNYREIRRRLEACEARTRIAWRGSSDTEVMLAAVAEWGLERAIKLFAGMFAFALWDRRERVLHLGRDRIGEKPLYYGWVGDVFLFGSELKALQAFPEWKMEVNFDSLSLFLKYGYVPAPYSIYKDIFKLRPGTIMSIPSIDPPDRSKTSSRTYWSAREIAENGLARPWEGTGKETVDSLDGLLKKVISQQMIADVPLGAFLSGGVDSSAVVALMQAQSRLPIRTFTIGFNEPGYNEAEYAKAVAGHLGTEHTELYVSPEDALALIPRLAVYYDEPFADSSQIPTCLVAQLTRPHVTVSLSGDGGDELFGGYTRYIFNQELWQKVEWLPLKARKSMARLLRAPRSETWEKMGIVFSPFLRRYGSRGTFGDKFHKLAEVLAIPDAEALYYRLMSLWVLPEEVLLRGGGCPDRDSGMEEADLPDFFSRMMYLDLISYLPDDCLVKVDRASMEASLESRAPFLDHRVVEFAWQVPKSLKIRDGQGKWLLRQVLYRYVPKELIERPKKGFSIPVADWLRGPLREWGEALLDERRLRNEGFFHPAVVREKWEEHLSGKRNWASRLWSLLMFQAWLETQQPGK